MLLSHSWNPGYRVDREGSEGSEVQERQCRAHDVGVGILTNDLETIWKRHYQKPGDVCAPLGKSTVTVKVSRKDGIMQGNPRILL